MFDNLINDFPLVAKLAGLWTKVAGLGLVRDGVGVLVCLAAAGGGIMVGLAGRRFFGLPAWICRRIIEAGGALWIVAAFYWITAWPLAWPASWVPPIVFLFVNSYVRHHQMFSILKLEDEERVTRLLGNPAAWLVIMMLFWWSGYQFMAMAGVMAQAVGANTAALVGWKKGRHRFKFQGVRHKTVEGSIAMFGASFLAIFLTTHHFARIPDVWFTPWCFFGALLTAGAATMAELFLPKPRADFWLPLLTSTVIYIYTMAGFG